MFAIASNSEGVIAAANPKFSYSFHRLPSGASPTETTTIISLLQSVSVNAHASARNQAAAQTFVDFLARPKQNAALRPGHRRPDRVPVPEGADPRLHVELAKLFAEQKYVINPQADWWNASVTLALQQNQIGLITGQRSIDDILNAMDAAWKQGRHLGERRLCGRRSTPSSRDTRLGCPVSSASRCLPRGSDVDETGQPWPGRLPGLLGRVAGSSAGVRGVSGPTLSQARDRHRDGRGDGPMPGRESCCGRQGLIPLPDTGSPRACSAHDGSPSRCSRTRRCRCRTSRPDGPPG